MYKPLALCLCLCLALVTAEGKKEKRRQEKQKISRRFFFTEDATDYENLFDAGDTSQCSENGIFLFEGPVWARELTTVCRCKDRVMSCRILPHPVRASPTLKAVASKLNPTSVGKTSSKNRLTGNGKPPVGTEVLEVKPKKDKKVVTPAKEPPSNVHKKQVKKTPKVIVNLDPVKPPKTPVIPTERRFMKPVHFDHDDHDDDDYLEDDSDSDDDDDDSHSIPLFRSAVRPVAIERRVMPPTLKPAIPRAQPAFALPTRKSVILPTGRPLPAPSGRPVNRGISHPIVRTSVHMESLPAGCLLAESLIACGNTRLTQMPIIRDTGVRSLFLADNKISKIPSHALAGLPNLEWLDLSKNKLDDFSLGRDVFRNLTKLRRLNLDGNNFTKVPALPPSLVELKINDNKLSGLTPHSFKGLYQLLTLELEDNYFHDGNVSPLAFKPLRKLIYLRLDDNKFRAIPSGLPASVQELHLSDNKIEVVHSGLLNKTTNLRVLNLSHNRIREDRIHPRAWIHLLKLEYLDLSHNKLVHVPSFLPVGLRQLILHHNQIERIPGYVFGHLRPGLDSLQLSYNRLREDGINEVSFLGLYSSLTELLLDHNQLRSIPRGILQLKNLQHLGLNHNYISYITMNSLCDTTAREDSLLLSVHLEYNLIDRRLIPPTAFSCIKTYQSVLLWPQRYEEHQE
ncbi:hypothetical protein Q8A67_009757 [Cirrhinus molitorella]|uniref:Extracellular matrix protein 2-like n=1 Tax=Cirrhinus molitorella TaxID=172907 RepID=A0AA88PR40_9TELE|nr:hypothetical protein Q8A67_009757 [Cirrhinus molitorella]